MLGLFHYQILYKTLEQIYLFTQEMEVANFVLENVAKSLNCEAGTIFLLDNQAGGALRPERGPVDPARRRPQDAPAATADPARGRCARGSESLR